MINKPSSPSTRREAMNALLLGELDALCDKVEGLNTTLKETEETIKNSINQLEVAGDKYNQAVLEANLRSKNEFLAYVESISKIVIATTNEEQQAIVRNLIREAVGDEVIALKKTLSAANKNQQGSLKDRWGKVLFICGLTAIMSAATTIELLKLFYR